MNNDDVEHWLKNFFLKPLEHPFFWIVLTVLVVYSGTLFYDIAYLDDDVLVAEQYSYNKNLTNIPQSFREDIFRKPAGEGSFYRPLERLTFIFDAQFGQGSIVFMSHLSNIFLHIISICLLFSLLLKLNIKKEAAFLFSLIFGIHPLTAQTVAFIAGRNDSLLAIFIFPALMFFLDFLKTQKLKYYAWHLTFFALALLTKETAAVLPFVCVSYILFFVDFKKIIGNYKPYLFLLAGWGSTLSLWFLIRQAVLHNLFTNADVHAISSIMKNLPAIIPAIGKIILPVQLSVFPILKDMTPIYGIIALTILFFWLIFSKNKNYRLILFGASWFGLFILLTLIKPANMTPEFSENRIYLPMVGFIFLLLGLGKISFWDGIRKKLGPEFQKKIIVTLGVMVIIIFASITMFRNRYYGDKISFWQNAAETSPSYPFNHINLGAMYYMDGNSDGAEKEFEKALAINSQEPMARNNLGLIHMDKGEFQKAEEEYDKELLSNPRYFGTYGNKAILYKKMGRIDDSLDAWKKALEINPGYSKALYNLFAYYYQKQDEKEAVYWAKESAARGIPLIPEMQKLLNPQQL